MGIFFTYLGLEFKKSIKVWKKTVCGMFLMLAVLAVGVAAVSIVLLQSQVFPVVDVAFTVPQGDKMTRMAMRVVEGMDSVKSICRFRYADRETALLKLREGEVQAVIDLPENFYEDVDSGVNTPAHIYFSSEGGDFALPVEVFRELLADGVSLLQTAEAGVYASLSIADQYSAPVGKEQIGNQIALLYMGEVMKRDGIFVKNVCSPWGTVNDMQYYFCAMVLLVLLMGGLNYGFLYQRQGRVVARKLALYGMGRWKMSLAKVTVMTGMLWAAGLLLYAAGCAASAVSGLGFIQPHVKTACGLLLPCVSMAAYFHAVYACAGNRMQGMTAVLALNLIMVIGSGLLLPAAYLPEMVGRLGEWMPLHVWSRYCLDLLFGTNPFWNPENLVDMLRMAGICAAGTGIGALALWKDT